MKAKTMHKVVFVLTAQGNDFFSAMTRVAVASLRVSNPEIRVIIACDSESNDAMHRAHDPLIGEVDDWLPVDTPSGPPGFRNRYVKTKLRFLIDGPFLFLDSDIFVRGDLRELFALDCDIAGARNHSRVAFAEQLWDQDRATLEAMGWEIGNQVYINGGVLFYNDTVITYRFAAEWHRRWLQSYNERNNYRDQPALNSALHAVQPRQNVLLDRYNAQILISPMVAHNAVILHYYSSAGQPAMTSFELLVAKVQQGIKLELHDIRKMIEHQYPWRCENAIDIWAIQGLMRHGSLSGWESAWLRGEMKKYVSYRVSRFLERARRFSK